MQLIEFYRALSFGKVDNTAIVCGSSDGSVELYNGTTCTGSRVFFTLHAYKEKITSRLYIDVSFIL